MGDAVSEIIPSTDARKGRSGFLMDPSVYVALCEAFGVDWRVSPPGAASVRVWEGHDLEWLDADGKVIR